MKSSVSIALKALAATVAICLVAAVLLPFFQKARVGGGPACLSNLKHLEMESLMYAEGNDSLPRASFWMDSILPFGSTERILHCPQVARENPYAYGYAMHRDLSGVRIATVANPATDPLEFDSWPLGRNANTNRVVIPGFSRHSGQNIGYADGHVRHRKQEARATRAKS